MQAMEEELKMLRSGVAVLLHDTTPVPGANAQLRRFCADLGRLLSGGAHPSEVDGANHNSSLLTTVPPGRGATPATSEL